MLEADCAKNYASIMYQCLQVRSFVTSVVPPRLHARSRERFEMFMISRNHFEGDLPQQIMPGQIQDHSGSSICFLCLNHFRPSVWPCFCLNFDLRLFRAPSNSTKKICQIRDYDSGVQFSFSPPHFSMCPHTRTWQVASPLLCNTHSDPLKTAPNEPLVLAPSSSQFLHM